MWHALSFSYWKPGLIVWCLELLNPIPRYTAVVEIDPETDKEVIDISDICGQRAMLARLLHGTAAASPSVIVVDK